MSNDSVFIVHNGNQSYLVDALNASMKVGHRTILIGNDQNIGSCCSNFYSDEMYLEKFEIFLRNYQHLSSNSFAFELHCFKRFFLLLDFARRLGLEKFWMIDSDVILLENLSHYANEISSSGYVASLSWQHQSDTPMSWSISPHISYWTLEALDDFVKFLIDLYLPKNISKLHEKYEFHLNNKIPGGVCDMTALYLWVNKGVRVHNNAASLELKSAMFDHNINAGSNYAENEYMTIPFLDIKKIKWSFRDRVFYAFHTDGGLRRVVALHFQGDAKRYISRFIGFKGLSLLICIDFIPRVIFRKLKRAINIS
jgi:hypothetical protein